MKMRCSTEGVNKHFLSLTICIDGYLSFEAMILYLYSILTIILGKERHHFSIATHNCTR